jgi:hypothetical protein
MTRRGLSFLLVVIATAVIVTSASAASQSCNTGYCSWGYNYVGSGVNSIVISDTHAFYDEHVAKNSGGWVIAGYGTTSYCNAGFTGTYDFWATPADLGCGGNAQTSFVQYDSGATSYLKIESWYNYP